MVKTSLDGGKRSAEEKGLRFCAPSTLEADRVQLQSDGVLHKVSGRGIALTFKVTPQETLKRRAVNVCNGYEVKKTEACRRVLAGDKVWTDANVLTKISPVEYSSPVLLLLLLF